MLKDPTKKPGELEAMYKIVLIGDSDVGKTSMLLRYSNDIFSANPCTVGVDFKIKTLQVDNRTIKIQIWDTAGQERFRSVIPMYYKGAKAILVVFDITSKESFEGAKKWIHEIEQTNKNCSIVLIGNKIDLISNRQVEESAVSDYKNAKKIEYYECSAKENLNVENIFQTIGNAIPIVEENTQNNKTVLNNKDDINTKKGYCC